MSWGSGAVSITGSTTGATSSATSPSTSGAVPEVHTFQNYSKLS